MQPVRESEPALRPPQRVRAWIIPGIVALCLIALGFAGWNNALRQLSVNGAKVPARLKDLPASPADIEAHGAAAQSVLPPEDARKRNALVPFVDGKLAQARPFVFAGSDQDRARALECLATAALYEAGDDTTGEAAVAQVVLNRVRHVAFPATVCGVVYQGSERSTGCQFSFTCDGSLRRRQSDAAWQRARIVANRALSGWVDLTVGLATHYHTDWVYPYWSPQLRKLAQVGTHLFFGWPGAWGKSGAFARTYRGNEIGPIGAAVIGAMADVGKPDPEPPKILGLPLPKAELPGGMGTVPLYGNRVRLVRGDGRGFGLLAPAGGAASTLVNAAMALCARPGPCEVLAWDNEDDIPGAFPIPQGARGTMLFEYNRQSANGILHFDCARLTIKDKRLCMGASVGAKEPAGLSGVRRKDG